jgi:hypothetical protein
MVVAHCHPMLLVHRFDQDFLSSINAAAASSTASGSSRLIPLSDQQLLLETLPTPAVAPGLERPEERVHHQPEVSTETTHPHFGIPIVTSSVLLHHHRASPATEIQVVDVMGFWEDMRVAFKGRMDSR